MNQQNQPNKINLLHQSNDIQPDIQKNLPESPNKHHLPKWSMILVIVVGIITIGLVGYFYYQYYFASEPVACTMEAKLCPDGSSVIRIAPDCEFAECPEITDPTVNWQMYRNEEYGFELKYPKYWKIFSESGIYQTRFIVKTTNEMRDFYNHLSETGCPGVCHTLSRNKDILENQFSILAKADECPYSEDFKKEIKKNFILFQSATGEISRVESIYNNNLKKCGMKLIGNDDYGVSLSSFYYRVGFLVDNKVVMIEFNLFSKGIFEEVDQFLEELEHDSDKYLEYLDNIDFDSEMVKNIIDSYDQVISTFKFIE